MISPLGVGLELGLHLAWVGVISDRVGDRLNKLRIVRVRVQNGSHMHGDAPLPSLKPALQAPRGQAPLVASQGAVQPGGHTKHASAKRGAHMPAALQSASRREQRSSQAWLATLQRILSPLHP